MIKKNVNEISNLEELIMSLEQSCITENDLRKIQLLRLEIEELKSRLPRESNTKYLSEIIQMENPDFGTNNLILAPVGSGKSTLIEDYLVKGQKGTILMLVSTKYLKDDICPESNELRKTKAENGCSKMMFTSRNKAKYGMEDYEIHVMTYAEFGKRISQDNVFVKDIKQIFCDEIHSLPEYKLISQSESLIHAIKYLFDKHEDKQIFYFTATSENLDRLEKHNPGQLKYVKTFDYRERKDIKRYLARSEYTINNIQQIIPHLKAKEKRFKYDNYKGLAFSNTISQMKQIQDILIELGLTPLTLWSEHAENKPLSDEQIEGRENIIRTNKIPEPYNFLIINGAMREGWNLKDPDVQIAIVNSSSETNIIQSRGRIRNDIDVLIYRTNDKSLKNDDFNLNSNYLNIPLTTSMKNNLCKELNIVNCNGKQAKWPAIKNIIIDNGYTIEDCRKTIDGKSQRVSIITEG